MGMCLPSLLICWGTQRPENNWSTQVLKAPFYSIEHFCFQQSSYLDAWSFAFVRGLILFWLYLCTLLEQDLEVCSRTLCARLTLLHCLAQSLTQVCPHLPTASVTAEPKTKNTRQHGQHLYHTCLTCTVPSVHLQGTVQSKPFFIHCHAPS